MKKTILSLLVVVIIFNFICINFSNAEDSTDSDTKIMMDKTQVDSILEDGVATTKDGNTMDIKLSETITGNIVGMLIGWIDIIPIILHGGVTMLAMQGGLLPDSRSA